MIDLHCHMLPQIDDGPQSLSQSLEMARIAVADGITIAACTPHISPGVYENTGAGIEHAVARLQSALEKAEIPLLLVTGADVHIAPGLQRELQTGHVPTLRHSRYFLLEPPVAIVPPRFEEYLFELMIAGFVPIITHPERLHWVDKHYAMLDRLVRSGVWMQLTAGSVLGKFGRHACHLSERMLDDGLVHILASDAHDTELRPPCLAEAVDAVEKRVGWEEAQRMVVTRPVGILRNMEPSDIESFEANAVAEN